MWPDHVTKDTIKQTAIIITNLTILFIAIILVIGFWSLFPLGSGSVETFEWELHPTDERINETLELSNYFSFEGMPLIIKLDNLDPTKDYILFQAESRNHRGFYVNITNKITTSVIVSPGFQTWALYRLELDIMVSVIDVYILEILYK